MLYVTKNERRKSVLVMNIDAESLSWECWLREINANRPYASME